MPNYTKSTVPFVVPTTDGKLIEEYFGLVSSQDNDFSIAHMVAPSGWSEPTQIPEFDEITIMISGKKQILIDDDLIELNAGETLMVKKGSHVQYSNPFNESADYWSVCISAFSLDLVHREEK